MKNYTIIPAGPLGELLIYANDTHVTGIYFVNQKYYPMIAADWVENPALPVLQLAAQQLQQYLAGTLTQFSVPFAFAGTSFQHRVWEQIAAVPFGQTITYGELAQRVGSPSAVRAAGAATGSNPISIIVPCHRIVGASGTLVGYAGGLDRKRHLLALERGEQELMRVKN
ncbi:MAG: methylated-DNA--[protein]-cysteine S-methyltransferase [Chthoniobacteraceae bacterium]